MARDGRQTRQRIDRTALELFAEKGVDQTTIGDIAHGAGISEGAIYRHYASKDALIWGLFSVNYRALAVHMNRLQAEERGLKAKLGAMVGAFCALYEADPAMFNFLLLVQHGMLPRVPEDMPTPVKVLRASMLEAIERDEISLGDADLATAVVLGIVLQPAVFKAYGDITRPLTELAGELTETAWRALGATTPKAGSAAA